MRRERALTIISQYAKGTFLIRFSRQNASSLVLVVSRGIDVKPSQFKIYIIPPYHSDRVAFEYQTVAKGVRRSISLYNLFMDLPFLQHLWYRKRGKDQDFVEKDRTKILMLFYARQDLW